MVGTRKQKGLESLCRSFQTVAPKTRNARLPTVAKQMVKTSRRWEAKDCSHRLAYWQHDRWSTQAACYRPRRMYSIWGRCPLHTVNGNSIHTISNRCYQFDHCVGWNTTSLVYWLPTCLGRSEGTINQSIFVYYIIVGPQLLTLIYSVKTYIKIMSKSNQASSLPQRRKRRAESLYGYQCSVQWCDDHGRSVNFTKQESRNKVSVSSVSAKECLAFIGRQSYLKKVKNFNVSSVGVAWHTTHDRHQKVVDHQVARRGKERVHGFVRLTKTPQKQQVLTIP